MDRTEFSCCLMLACMLGGGIHASAQEVPARLLESLASDEFKEREAGQLALLAWAEEHQPAALDGVWMQYRSSPDPEIRQRCLMVLRELIAKRYLSEGPGFLGIGLNYGRVAPPGEIAPVHAVLVTAVRQDTPASRAGIRIGDMIVGLDDKGWTNENSQVDFSERIAAKKPGTTVKLEIVRDGKRVEIEAVLKRRPANLEFLRFGLPQADAAAEERAAIDAYFKAWLGERMSRK